MTLTTRPLATDLRRPIIVGLAVVGAGLLLWSRLSGLDQSLYTDEIETVRSYATQGPSAIFAGDTRINDHRLFSLLTWMTIKALPATEIVLRLWGVLPAIAGTVVLVVWAHRRHGLAVSTTLGALLVMAPDLVFLSRAARGYGLTFLALSLAVIGTDMVLHERRWGITILATGSLVALLTFPLTILPIGVVWVGVLALQPRARRRLAAVGGGIAIVTVFWYLPMLHRTLTIVGNFQDHRLLAPRPVHAIVTGPASHLASLLRQIPEISHLVALALAVLVLFSCVVVARRRQRRLVMILTAAVLASWGTVVALRIAIYGRYLSFLTVPVLVLVALGVGTAWRDLSRGPPRRVMAAGLVIVIGAMLPGFLRATAPITSQPLEDGRRAATLIDDFDPDVVLTNHVERSVTYYLDRPMQEMGPRALSQRTCSVGGRVAVLIENPGARRVDVACLRERGAAHVRVEQRGRGWFKDVWLLEAGAAPVSGRR